MSDQRHKYKHLSPEASLVAELLERTFNLPTTYKEKNIGPDPEIPEGLNLEVIDRVSRLRHEPHYFREFRKKALTTWQRMSLPSWAFFDAPQPEYGNQIFYSVPKRPSAPEASKIEDTVNQLNLPETETLNNVEQTQSKEIALDTVVGSLSVLNTLKGQLRKNGIIFCSLNQAMRWYPDLVRQYLGKIVPIHDNYYASLNSAIFSDGSFCFVPKDVKCDVELSTYFRIEEQQESGQFERTLIIAQEGSYVSYLEGCTAPKYDDNQFHAAVVELFAAEDAEIKYSTVQNWYTGDEFGVGGLYNLVTKRGICSGDRAKISWTQVEMGSAITWKYPSCILVGKCSRGEFYSVSFTSKYQQADTGSKMIHIGPYTKSKIVSKSVSTGFSQNVYRGAVKMGPRAYKAHNCTKCDSILLGPNTLTCTLPYLTSAIRKCHIEHEAKVEPINKDHVFYMQQRGLPEEYCIGVLVSGFCEEVCLKLPLEFGVETQFLLAMKVEESLG